VGPVEACEIAEQLAGALAAAHARRVVHRDIKPANVLISADGQVKVGDFGIARLFDGNGDGAATIVGTPRYMAPEQAHGKLGSPATDVYCAGIVLYEMLAGHPPFDAKTVVELALRHVQDEPPALPDHTPQALVEVIERALRKDPAERYGDGRALARALSEARDELPDEDEYVAPGVSTGAVGLLERELGTSTTAPLVRARRRPPPPKGPTGTRVASPASPRRNVNPAERRQRLALFACVLALVGGMVAAALAIAPGHVRVPNLHGLSSSRASAAARKLHLRVKFSHRHSELAPGTVVGQAPHPGVRVSDGAALTVTLSDGPPPVSVPKLVGASSAAAQATLGQDKLRASVMLVTAPPGFAPGTVAAQSPPAGASRVRGSTVTLSVAESPQWRPLTSFQGLGSARSVPFKIRGAHWQVVYGMGYKGTCELLFICSGPTATVTNVTTGATVDQFDLGEGSGKTHTFQTGPGTYQISVSPGSDTAQWSIKVDDWY
jgi:serine/threonine-protein kinase